MGGSHRWEYFRSMHRYSPDDRRYHDRCQAAVELLRMWSNISEPDLSPTGGRFRIRSGPSLDKLVEWTESYLNYPDIPTGGSLNP